MKTIHHKNELEVSNAIQMCQCAEEFHHKVEDLQKYHTHTNTDKHRHTDVRTHKRTHTHTHTHKQMN